MIDFWGKRQNSEQPSPKLPLSNYRFSVNKKIKEKCRFMGLWNAGAAYLHRSFGTL